MSFKDPEKHVQCSLETPQFSTKPDIAMCTLLKNDMFDFIFQERVTFNNFF